MKDETTNGDSPVKQTENGKEGGGKMVGVPYFFLPPSVVGFHREDDSEPWAGDREYFQGIVACETLRVLAFQLRHSVGDSIYNIRNPELLASPEDETCMNGRDLAVRLEEELPVFQKKLEKKIEKMKKRPILEKVADHLKASNLERNIFRHVLCRLAGLDGRDRYFSDLDFYAEQATSSRVSVLLVSEIFTSSDSGQRVTVADVLDLLSSSSEWVREHIYNQSGHVGSNVCDLPSQVVRVFMGLEISSVEFGNIQSKAIRETLLEDEWFQKTETGKAVKVGLDKAQKAMDQMKKRKEAGEGSASALKAALQENTASNPNKKRRVLDILSVMSATKADAKPVAAKSETASTASGEDMLVDSATSPTDEKTKDEFGPYKSNLDYLEDQTKLMKKVRTLVRAKTHLHLSEEASQGGMPGAVPHYYPPQQEDWQFIGRGRRGEANGKKLEQQIAAWEQEVAKLEDMIHARLALTQEESNWEPRLEQLCSALGLSRFEKFCILTMVTFVITPQGYGKSQGTRAMVGALIDSFCETLEERMESRRYFYRSNTLIREGILTLMQNDFKTDLTECRVELDRRMFDWIVSLDTELSETVDGSHLYVPDVSLDDVVLPEETKKRVCDSVMNHDAVKAIFEKLEVDRKISYGLGNILLFYGHSGTGKTMLANAIATILKKKVLLVNFPDLGLNQSGQIIKFLFREARINKALLFFDECESLFLSRNKGGRSINMILTELERFEDLCILATNRACDLDEAMHRRISLAIEFRKPDHIMREKIWQTLKPPKLPIDDNINFTMIAKKFELTGGLIKNAWLQAVSLMVRRSGKTISEEDLVQASSEQVLGQLSMDDFDRRVVPTAGVDAMALTPTIKDALHQIVHNSKAQSVLFGQWGFEKIHRSTTGMSALFTGPSGTGKTMAAEAVGFDLGRPLLVVNVAELVDKYVGETGKNIQSIFEDAKKKDAVLVFDECEGLFGSRGMGSGGSTSRHDSMNVGILLQYIENFSGVCIAITNMKSVIDEAFFRRFRFVLDFKLPDVEAREKIWNLLVPAECPLEKDVKFRELAARFQMSGGAIKNALLRAATIAALRSDKDKRIVSMEDLTKACSSEVEKQGGQYGQAGMYS